MQERERRTTCRQCLLLTSFGSSLFLLNVLYFFCLLRRYETEKRREEKRREEKRMEGRREEGSREEGGHFSLFLLGCLLLAE